MGLDIYFSKCSYKEIGYFRKVNFLVKFFEDKGFFVSNTTEFEVTKEDVLDLLDKCEEVLANPDRANILLPTREGFFFGSIQYDSGYFDDVAEVKNYITNILLPELENLKDNEYINFNISY